MTKHQKKIIDDLEFIHTYDRYEREKLIQRVIREFDRATDAYLASIHPEARKLHERLESLS